MGSRPLPPAWDCPETVSEHRLLFLFLFLAQELPFGKLQLKTHDQKRNSLADYSLAENLEEGGRMCLSRKEETEAGARPPAPRGGSSDTMLLVVSPWRTCLTSGAARAGSSCASRTLNPARAARSHLLLCAFGSFLPGSVGEKTKDAQSVCILDNIFFFIRQNGCLSEIQM